MATPTVKSTYSLDVHTVRTLESLASRWGVSKSEALRRAIRSAAGGEPIESERATVKALDELQKSLRLSRGAALRWETRIQAERVASSKRRTR